MLDQFEKDYYIALNEGISLNPILNSFQETVHKFNIDDTLVQAFLTSMKTDLVKKSYTEEEFKNYIYGSADVVGLMCLKIFVNGNRHGYEELKPHAMRLGSAFQKVNFLRDLNDDTNLLKRIYFPALNGGDLNTKTKKYIINDIKGDLDEALVGIKKLPDAAKTGVYTAYLYYKALTKKIAKTPASKIMNARIRISNFRKLVLLAHAYVACKLKLV